MSDLLWYVYQQGQQLGPFGDQQIIQMINTNMIAQDGYLFKVGWKDWRPIEECHVELGIEGGSEEPNLSRREGAPRASIQGRVIVHNNGQLAIGAGVNISVTGIFIETTEELFTIGEHLSLSVRCDGVSKPFNAKARVIRYNSDEKFAVGYGLQFEQIDEGIREQIRSLVNQSQPLQQTDVAK